MTSGSAGSFLVDTNVLYYAADLSAGPKSVIATDIIETAVEARTFIITGQTMSEFLFGLDTPEAGRKARAGQRHRACSGTGARPSAI